MLEVKMINHQVTAQVLITCNGVLYEIVEVVLITCEVGDERLKFS